VDIVEVIVERQVAAAIERGDMETPTLSGTRISDIDERRRSGWWAERFVRDESAKADPKPDAGVEMRAAWAERTRNLYR
jgi:hypothetical protein